MDLPDSRERPGWIFQVEDTHVDITVRSGGPPGHAPEQPGGGDLGFGKKIDSSHDFGKSVSLNWWCEPPLEFEDDRYDYKTEVYFVGKLFQKILSENDIEEFQYKTLLARMCEHAPERRIESFAEVRRVALAAGFVDIPFREDELAVYRRFSSTLHNVISKIDQGAKYMIDGDRIQRALEDTYRNTMLERCFRRIHFSFDVFWTAPTITALTNSSQSIF